MILCSQSGAIGLGESKEKKRLKMPVSLEEEPTALTIQMEAAQTESLPVPAIIVLNISPCQPLWTIYQQIYHFGGFTNTIQRPSIG